MTGGLQKEIKKKRPFDSVEEEAMLNLLRTSDQVQCQFGRFLREFGITQPQYNILRILRGEGAPLPILEVASRMVAVVPGITGLIDRLEHSGLVERIRCERDRRVIYVNITEKARQLVQQLDEPVVAFNRQMTSGLTQAEIRELSRLLEKVRQPLTSSE
jgi:DNA-binding MarR family transcriptional regulator